MSLFVSVLRCWCHCRFYIPVPVLLAIAVAGPRVGLGAGFGCVGLTLPAILVPVWYSGTGQSKLINSVLEPGPVFVHVLAGSTGDLGTCFTMRFLLPVSIKVWWRLGCRCLGRYRSATVNWHYGVCFQTLYPTSKKQIFPKSWDFLDPLTLNNLSEFV